jgi:hypothetical protein
MAKYCRDNESIFISEFGNIKINKNGREYITKGRKNTDNYMVICLKNKSVQVHRLVAEYFIPNPLNKKIVNHIDGNKSNNRADNLEWATVRENALHYHKLKRQKNNTENTHIKISVTINGNIISLLRDICSKMNTNESVIIEKIIDLFLINAGIPAGSLEPVKNGRRKLSAQNTAKVLAVLQGLQGEIDNYLESKA